MQGNISRGQENSARRRSSALGTAEVFEEKLGISPA